jgi:hypothetical protein
MLMVDNVSSFFGNIFPFEALPFQNIHLIQETDYKRTLSEISFVRSNSFVR